VSGMRHTLGASGTNDSGREWRKSSRSYGGGNCVEVAVPHNECICVRDSKNPDGTVLQFTPTAWDAFMASLPELSRLVDYARHKACSSWGPGPR
jgi:Domain of unknown function (DUF397)